MQFPVKFLTEELDILIIKLKLETKNKQEQLETFSQILNRYSQCDTGN